MSVQRLLTELPAFAELQAHAKRLRGAAIEPLYTSEPMRAERFTAQAAGLHLDYSKHLLDTAALNTLLTLGEQANLASRSEALLAGEPINNTEGRPALHTLLRASADTNQTEKYAQICAAREQVKTLSNALNQQERCGYTGKPITDVVNIGIGGSDLGPRLVTEALKPFHGAITCHYVANVDPSDIEATLSALDAHTTTFIICSKSFRTEETLANSLTARQWMLDSGAKADDLDKHFLAVTTNLEAAAKFGITAENCLPMWDWVGGRYSVWSAVGLSCAIAIGWENFSHFLGGAETLDAHFANSPLEQNMPALMALLEVWYCNFLGTSNHVVLPYEHNLRHLPDYLQQLTMESNGKRVNSSGTELDYDTGSILWGSAGTMGQHSFHQLLHQGTLLSPVDFILPLSTQTKNTQQHELLVANCLAQSRALMVGRSLNESEISLLDRGVSAERAATLAPHLVMPGNRPNSVITMQALTPKTLGAILALYEHRTFCSSQIWGINPFDQWGVELGKDIGTDILAKIQGDADSKIMDPATERLLEAFKKAQK